MSRWIREADGWRRAARHHAHRGAIRRLGQVGAGFIASRGEDCAVRVRAADGRRMVFEAGHDDFVTDALYQDGTILGCSYDGRIRRHDGALLCT